MLAALRITGRLSGLITLYGIKNCDTVKKARKWLDELGWENLVNRRSTSWRALDEATREGMNEDSALAAIMAQPTLIKRPLLDIGHERFAGFSAATYQKIFSKHKL